MEPIDDDDLLKKLQQELGQAYESPMKSVMVQLHEMYTELKAAGFTRREAMYMVSRLFNFMVIGGIDPDKQD